MWYLLLLYRFMEYRYAYGYYESSQEKRFYCAELDATGNLQEEDRGSVY